MLLIIILETFLDAKDLKPGNSECLHLKYMLFGLSVDVGSLYLT